MNLARINTNLLIALDLLLTHGSVRLAAERQGVTASAMSHSLRSLRDMFGDPLLVRTSRGMVPTPLAERLRGPLRRALHELEHAVTDGPDFDPATARRGFVIAAPDFLSTLLLPAVVRVLEDEAPGLDVEIRPIARVGRLELAQASDLAEGSLDLVMGAALDPLPGIRSERLYEERFVCVVREDHPRAHDTLDLETYTAIPHALITITDERSPTWIDEALAEHGLTRRIAARTRYFMAAPLLVSESDLVLTCPLQLARYFAARLPLRILEPPLDLPRYHEQLVWHERFDGDPGSRWLRALLSRAAADAVSS